MNYHQLHVFCEIAEKKSFTAAAESLFISTSGLSKTIHSLENELDVTLLNRDRNNVTLTPAGRCFYEFAKKQLLAQKEVLAQLGKFQHHRDNNIRIAMTTSQRYYSLLSPIQSFQKTHPEITFSISEYEKDVIWKKIDSMETDLAISWYDDTYNVHPENYDINCFMDEKRVLICSKHHPLADKNPAALADFKDSFFVFPDNALQKNLYQDLCESCGFTPKVGAFYSSIETQFDLVAKEFGVSFVNEGMVHQYYTPEIAALDITPTLSTSLAIIKLKTTKTPVIKEFIEYYLENVK